MGGTNQAVLTQGRSGKIEILGGIPKFFKIYIRDKKPPGKISFTSLDPGTSFKAFLSYTNKKPDENQNDDEKFVGHVPKPPLSFSIKSSKHGREELFDYDTVYLGIVSERDTKISLLITFKPDPRNRTFVVPKCY